MRVGFSGDSETPADFESVVVVVEVVVVDGKEVAAYTLHPPPAAFVRPAPLVCNSADRFRVERPDGTRV